jgi:hypothetical protein
VISRKDKNKQLPLLSQRKLALKGLSHEIDFKNVDENGQILALIRAAAGFEFFGGSSDFVEPIEAKLLTPGELQLSVGLLFAHQ